MSKSKTKSFHVTQMALKDCKTPNKEPSYIESSPSPLPLTNTHSLTHTHVQPVMHTFKQTLKTLNVFIRLPMLDPFGHI